MRTAFLALALLTTACSSEIDDKTAAKVEDAAPAAAAPGGKALVVPAGAVPLSKDSTLTWVGAKVTKDHPGGFKALDGYGIVRDGTLESAVVEIDMSSTFSDVAKLTKHLLDEDFFFVSKYPKSTFALTGVEAGSGDASHTVVGSLTLRGVTKELRFPATVTVEGNAATVAAEFTLNRKDFGIEYAGKADDLIRDEVLVKGTLRFGG